MGEKIEDILTDEEVEIMNNLFEKVSGLIDGNSEQLIAQQVAKWRDDQVVSDAKKKKLMRIVGYGLIATGVGSIITGLVQSKGGF